MAKSTVTGWQRLDTRPLLVGDLCRFVYQGNTYLASPRLIEGKTDAEIIATVCVEPVVDRH